MNKILIVDDTKLMLHTARDTILRHKDIFADVTICDNGPEALALIESQKFDIVLLDIVMPDMTGIEVLQHLHINDYLSTMKVLMFSSLTDKKALKTCFSLGATDFITKPIEEDEFIARITNAINEQNLKSQFRATIDLMKKQNDKLSQLYQQLSDAENQMIQQEQMAGVGQLAAGVAHEINNPIGFVKSNLSSMHLYLKDSLTQLSYYEQKYGKLSSEEFPNSLDTEFIKEDAESVYEEIREGIHRVEIIVNSLRSFSIVDNDSGLIETEFAKALNDIFVLLNSEIGSQIEVERFYSDVEPIVVNGGEFHLALLNIIKNALYAVKSDTKPQKIIRLTIDDDSKYVYCHIYDNGIGISEEDLSVIFNPFFTTKPVGEGLGLGLSMAYDIIVNKHKGRLDAVSKKGEWTNISIGLPKASLLKVSTMSLY